MATIKDIAQRAGVSTATVSMVLNGKDCITKKTKEKVLLAARELDYVPSITAKALKTKRSGCIALLIGDISNPFFPEIIKGVEEAALSRSYSVIIYDLLGSRRNLVSQLNRAVSQGVDGFFLTGARDVSREERERLLALSQEGYQIVTTNRCLGWGAFPLIKMHEEPQVDAILSKLVAYGHKRIGCIGGQADAWISQLRRRAFQTVLEQYQLFFPEYVIDSGFDYEGGRTATRALLEQHPEITAVMCVNDTTAIGCQAEARNMGKRVPEDLSVFGIDGIQCMRYFTPELTTIDTHRYECGYAGCMRLIDRIGHGKKLSAELEQEITVDSTVRMGGTIAPPGQRNIF